MGVISECCESNCASCLSPQDLICALGVWTVPGQGDTSASRAARTAAPASALWWRTPMAAVWSRGGTLPLTLLRPLKVGAAGSSIWLQINGTRTQTGQHPYDPSAECLNICYSIYVVWVGASSSHQSCTMTSQTPSGCNAGSQLPTGSAVCVIVNVRR